MKLKFLRVAGCCSCVVDSMMLVVCVLISSEDLKTKKSKTKTKTREQLFVHIDLRAV